MMMMLVTAAMKAAWLCALSLRSPLSAVTPAPQVLSLLLLADHRHVMLTPPGLISKRKLLHSLSSLLGRIDLVVLWFCLQPLPIPPDQPLCRRLPAARRVSLLLIPPLPLSQPASLGERGLWL